MHKVSDTMQLRINCTKETETFFFNSLTNKPLSKTLSEAFEASKMHSTLYFLYLWNALFHRQTVAYTQENLTYYKIN